MKILLGRGTATQNDLYTGADGEITIDKTTWSLRIHDGLTHGGHAVEGEQAVNFPVQTSSHRQSTACANRFASPSLALATLPSAVASRWAAISSELTANHALSC